MVTKEVVSSVVNSLNKKFISELDNKLESIYLVGSYAHNNYTLSRPDINWLLLWKSEPNAQALWKQGTILAHLRTEYMHDISIRPETRPFKFSFPLKPQLPDLFLNITNAVYASSPDALLTRNSSIPAYVWAGFMDKAHLIFGKDIRSFKFTLSKKDILATAFQKLASHKIQLLRIPLTYHLQEQTSLVYNETLTHAKALVYFGTEILATDKQLEQHSFLKQISHKDTLPNFYKDKLPQSYESVAYILKARSYYDSWKHTLEKSKNLYFHTMYFHSLLEKKVKELTNNG